jgi:uncharacterized protein (DUF302 family)
MKLIKLVCLFILVVGVTTAGAVEGLVKAKSPYSVTITMDRLETAVTDKGLKVFARIDHAAGAAGIGQSLRPTELLIFGNPRGGTPFMQCAQTVAIELPLKALVWEDQDGTVWLGYNSPRYLAKRHAADSCAVVKKLEQVLAGLADAVLD